MRSLFISLLTAALLVLAACDSAPKGPVTLTGEKAQLGTWVKITVTAPDKAAAQASLDAAFGRLAELEKILSAQEAQSELSRVNNFASQAGMAVSDDLFRAIEAGFQWFSRTDGAFDIAASPLIALWMTCGKANRLPTDAEITAARARTGANRILLNKEDRTVRLPDGMRLHLGGLGKGFCADELAALLRARGARSALVGMSGDIHCLGSRADGGPWRVGVQDPRDPDNPEALVTVLQLHDHAVSTSGNYHRYAVIQGKRYSHIIDPRTGRTADAVPSVTVIAPHTLTTDILGTALSVLGVEEGLKRVESLPGVEALFITIDEKGELALTRSSGFAAFEAASASAPAQRK